MAIFAGGIAGLGVAGMGGKTTAGSLAVRLTPGATGIRVKGAGGNVPGFRGSGQTGMAWDNFKPLVANAKRAAQSRLGQLAVGYAAHEAYQTGKKEWNSQRRRGR